MDDSQGSDVFSKSVDLFCDSPTVNMDQDTFESFIANTKLALSKRCGIQKTSFSTCFASLLDDCDMSICKSLDLIIDLLTESSVPLNKLIEYISNIVDLLQMLSDYLKHLVESVALACCSLKTFPTTTGKILMTVFTHCKDSELIYGIYLGAVEKQLKDLFRMCHELQLTYLMILEKHFTFDFAEKEEQDIFVEALDINLQIGQIVHKLDVKTMAEQWKAFTAICEKYSSHLYDNNIFYNCTKILCEMIENNIKNVAETNQDEKVYVRSIKVTCFTLKILLKVCTIFKHTTVKKYEHIVGFLVFTFLNSSPYFELAGKSSNFITLMNTNVTGPMECLLKELILDEKFVQCLTTYDIKENKNNDGQLGFILLIVAAMKIEIQMDTENRSSNIKIWLIECIYSILPYCHVWFNIGLKFNVEPLSAQHKTVGLNEYLLIHTLAIVVKMNNEQYNFVENRMIKAVLSTDCMTALFSANLWTLLSRFSCKELLLTQTLNLCKFYKRLENHVSFENSPQKVHLTYTIAKLFQAMNCEDKAEMYNTLSLDKNMSIWSVLKVKDLPEEMRRTSEDVVMNKLKLMLSNLAGDYISSREDVANLTNLMNLASGFSFSNDNLLVDNVVHAWLKLCPKDNIILVQSLECGTLWCIQFIEALVSLTSSMADVISNRTQDLVKILYVISKVTQTNCLELKLLLIDVLCKFCTTKLYDGSDTLEECLLVESFRNIMQSEESIVINKLILLLYKNIDQLNLNKVISEAIQGKYELKETWLELNKYGIIRKHYIEEKRILEASRSHEFSHKCIKENNECDHSDNAIEVNRSGNNFDLIDIDNLFDTDNDTEPQCKRVKLNANEVNDIIARLEVDVLKLGKVKENITCEHQLKIRDLCSHLQNIID